MSGTTLTATTSTPLGSLVPPAPIAASTASALAAVAAVPNYAGPAPLGAADPAAIATANAVATFPSNGDLTLGSPAYTAAAAAVGAAQVAIRSGVASTEAAMGAPLAVSAVARTPLGVADPGAAQVILGRFLIWTQRLAGLTLMQNFVGRAVNNLDNAGA